MYSVTVMQLDRTTAAYKRMTEAGFTFEDPIEVLQGGKRCWAITFTCVCGKKEVALWQADQVSEFIPMDICEILEYGGAVSVKHLEEDGYTPEQIAEIRKPYENLI